MTVDARDRSATQPRHAPRPATPDTAHERLLEAIAAKCRGRTLVISRRETCATDAIERRGLTVRAATDAASSRRSGAARKVSDLNGRGRFKTVVVIDSLEHVSKRASEGILAAAWERVRPGGRLLAVVPNEDCVPGAAARTSFDRRRLKKLLRPLGGKVRAVTEQPYRWLVLYAEKPREGRGRSTAPRDERYRFTAELCRGKTIELSCGEGWLSEMIHARGLQVVGVDMSREKIETARGRCPDIEFIASDIRDLDLPNASFETVVLAEVLEHLPESVGAEVIDIAGRLLQPGGRLVISVPNEDCVPHPNHIRQFDRRSLEAILRPFGRPVLVSEQPYKWLLMYVEKNR